MKKAALLKKTPIDPENIIGTKWVSWEELFGNHVTVEFVDKTHCMYTMMFNNYPITYTVKEGNIFISNIQGPFELIGDVLFNNDLPAFKKVA